MSYEYSKDSIAFKRAIFEVTDQHILDAVESTPMIPATSLCVKNTHGDYFADGIVGYRAKFPSGNNVMISVSLVDIVKDRIIEYESGMFHVYGEGQTIQRGAQYGAQYSSNPPWIRSKHIIQDPSILQFGSKLRVYSYIPLHGMQCEISYPTDGVKRAIKSLCESRPFYRDVIRVYDGNKSGVA